MATGIKALFFDMFGTLVDWRAGVARDAAAILKPLGYTLDWGLFADAWRGEYQPAMEEVRQGHFAYSRLDILHRHNLEKILPRFGIGGIPEAAKASLNLAWHRLDGWPDTTSGLKRLKAKYLIAPVSNGNISLLVDLARRNDIPWDAILGADLARDYKPKPLVYLSACGAFDLQPGACMMVAAHPGDLTAAAACGLKTAYIARPDEHGPGRGDNPPRGAVDIRASSVEDLAAQLDA